MLMRSITPQVYISHKSNELKNRSVGWGGDGGVRRILNVSR